MELFKWRWNSKREKNVPTTSRRKLDKGVYRHILKEEILIKRNTWQLFSLTKDERTTNYRKHSMSCLSRFTDVWISAHDQAQWSSFTYGFISRGFIYPPTTLVWNKWSSFWHIIKRSSVAWCYVTHNDRILHFISSYHTDILSSHIVARRMGTVHGYFERERKHVK